MRVTKSCARFPCFTGVPDARFPCFTGVPDARFPCFTGVPDARFPCFTGVPDARFPCFTGVPDARFPCFTGVPDARFPCFTGVPDARFPCFTGVPDARFPCFTGVPDTRFACFACFAGFCPLSRYGVSMVMEEKLIERRIQLNRGSFILTIPRTIVERAGIHKGQSVRFQVRDGEIVISPLSIGLDPAKVRPIKTECLRVQEAAAGA